MNPPLVVAAEKQARKSGESRCQEKQRQDQIVAEGQTLPATVIVCRRYWRSGVVLGTAGEVDHAVRSHLTKSVDLGPIAATSLVELATDFHCAI